MVETNYRTLLIKIDLKFWFKLNRVWQNETQTFAASQHNEPQDWSDAGVSIGHDCGRAGRREHTHRGVGLVFFK